MKEDKIFNNRFNSGDLEYEQFKKITVDEIHRPKDSFDDYISSKVQNELYEIFISSKFHESYNGSKKVPRSEAAEIYYFFDEKLINSELSSSFEKFINIAEFMGITYEVLYDEISPAHKEIILKELDEKYGIFKKKKIYRLF